MGMDFNFNSSGTCFISGYAQLPKYDYEFEIKKRKREIENLKLWKSLKKGYYVFSENENIHIVNINSDLKHILMSDGSVIYIDNIHKYKFIKKISKPK